MGMCPEALGDADLIGAVDEEEGLVVGGVGRAPPVQEAVDVADREGLLDVVGPCQPFALAPGGVPVVVDGVEGRPLRLPDLLGGREWGARGGAVAMAGYESEGVLGAGLLDPG